jgi:hypothetical protein
VLATWPAVEHVGSRFFAVARPVPGEASAGDHLQSGYRLWLLGHQLEGGRAPWLDPYTFRPESDPAVNFEAWPFGVPYWPLSAAFGAVLAWNLFLLLTYLTAGGLACAWLRELGLQRGAALAGGLAYAIAPYRVAQSAGHLLGAISLLLPLALWSFERARRGSVWWLVLSGAAIASIPLSGQVHLALGAVPFVLLYALCRTREPRMLGGAAAGALAAAGAGLLVQRLSISGSISSGGRTLAEVAHYSADGLDFVTRHRRHGLESFAFLGWLTPLLAVAGLVVLVRVRQLGLGLVLAIGAVVPILLALGTHMPLYSTLWHHVGPLRYPRVPERLLPIACLALAALAAFAVARIAEAFPQRATVCYLALVVALAADLRVGVYESARADPGNRAYSALRGRAPGRLLELPVIHPGVDLGSVYLYYDQQAQRQRPGGYSTVAPERAAMLALRLEPLNCGDWRPGTARLLRSLGVRYVALHAGLYAGTGRAWFAWQSLVAHGYGDLASDGSVTTFAPGQPRGQPRVPEPRRPVVFCQGWRGREPRHRHTAFWARGPRLRVALTTRAPDRTTFSVAGRAVRSVRVTHPTTIEVPLGAGGWHLVGVDVVRTDRGLRLDSVRSVSP